MHFLLARIPLIRRPFYQLDLARQERNRALLERDSAIKERDELRLKLQDAAAADGSNPSHRSAESEPSPRRLCVFCKKEVEAWLPFRIRASDISDFLSRVEAVGSNVERFLCPHCSSIDRERHLHLFLERLRIMETIRGGSVLHMAPEARLPEYIESYDLSPYVRGDLSPSDDSIQRIDLHQIPFPDETFDLVICNHVLEHVEDPAAALVEMRRVLKPGGRAICQTPFARRLTNTLEDPLLQSADDRLFFYGQEDHLRLFGSDIEQLIRGAGFTGRLVPHGEILPDVDPELLGVNEKEPFFDFVRNTAGA
jgi:SAM-dependent methyltransferase